MHCKTCHSSLAELTVHRCPECGRPFDPNDANTFEARQPFTMRERFMFVAIDAGIPCMMLGMIYAIEYIMAPIAPGSPTAMVGRFVKASVLVAGIVGTIIGQFWRFPGKKVWNRAFHS